MLMLQQGTNLNKEGACQIVKRCGLYCKRSVTTYADDSERQKSCSTPGLSSSTYGLLKHDFTHPSSQ